MISFDSLGYLVTMLQTGLQIPAGLCGRSELTSGDFNSQKWNQFAMSAGSSEFATYHREVNPENLMEAHSYVCEQTSMHTAAYLYNFFTYAARFLIRRMDMPFWVCLVSSVLLQSFRDCQEPHWSKDSLHGTRRGSCWTDNNVGSKALPITWSWSRYCHAIDVIFSPCRKTLSLFSWRIHRRRLPIIWSGRTEMTTTQTDSFQVQLILETAWRLQSMTIKFCG